MRILSRIFRSDAKVGIIKIITDERRNLNWTVVGAREGDESFIKDNEIEYTITDVSGGGARTTKLEEVNKI